MCRTASHLPRLLHLTYGLGPVLHVLLWGGVGGTLDRDGRGGGNSDTVGKDVILYYLKHLSSLLVHG